METIRSENALSALWATSRSFPPLLDAALEVYRHLETTSKSYDVTSICILSAFWFSFFDTG